MPSLSEKLKSLGVRVGASDLRPPEFDDRYEIGSAVTGSLISTPAGDTFIHEERFAPDYRHGSASIQLAATLDVLSEWAGDPRLGKLPIESFAFLDTETSGLAGGTGTYAFLVGAGRFLNGELLLQQFFMRDPSEEPALLEGLAAFLAPSQALVTFNGKAFDAPLLSTRYRLHQIPIPFKDYAHLDLLPLARRLWRDRLESRALKYLEENILHSPRSIEEVPGYEIPFLYFDYLRTHDARPLKGVFYHNAMDVVAMAALLSHTAALLADPFQESIEHGLDVIALAKLYEDIGHWDTAARLFERGLEMDLGEEDFWKAVNRMSVLQKRRGDFEGAVKLWEKAASDGHIYACVELAKYYEHNRRDRESALRWTQAGLKQARHADLPLYIRKHWLEELTHRLERLKAKSNK